MTVRRASPWRIPPSDVAAGAAELLRLSHACLPELRAAFPVGGALVTGPSVPPPRPLDAPLGEKERLGFVARLLGLACFLGSRGLGLDAAALAGLGSRPGHDGVPWLSGPPAPSWRALPPALVAALGAVRAAGRPVAPGSETELWQQVEEALERPPDEAAAALLRGALRGRDRSEPAERLLAGLLADPRFPGGVRADLLGLVFPAFPAAGPEGAIACATGPAALLVARGVARRSLPERGFAEIHPADPLAEGSALEGLVRAMAGTPVAAALERIAAGGAPEPLAGAFTLVGVEPGAWDGRSRRLFEGELGSLPLVERIEVRRSGIRPWDERALVAPRLTPDEVPSVVWLPFASPIEAGTSWRELARLSGGDPGTLVARAREHLRGGDPERGSPSPARALLAAALLAGGFDAGELARAASIAVEEARAAIEEGLLDGTLVPAGTGAAFRDEAERRALAGRPGRRAVADVCRRLGEGPIAAPRLAVARLALGAADDVEAGRAAFAAALAAGDAGLARELLARAPASDPDLGDPVGAVEVLAGGGQKERALEAAARIGEGPPRALPLERRERAARFLARLGAGDQALLLLQGPEDAAGRLARVEVLLALRRDAEAESELEAVVPARPEEEGRAALLAAEIADRRQDLAGAERALERLAGRVGTGGLDGGALALTAGRLAMDLGRTGEAAASFARARDAARGPAARADAAFDLSSALFDAGRPREAREALEEALSLYAAAGEEDRYLSALAQRAFFSLRQGDAQAARRDLDRVIAHDSVPGRAHQLLFVVPVWQELALADGDLEEAETAFRTAAAAPGAAGHPGWREVLVREGHRLLLARDLRRARARLEEAGPLSDTRVRVEPLRQRLLASLRIDAKEAGPARGGVEAEDDLLAAEERLARGEPPGKTALARLAGLGPLEGAARVVEWRHRFGETLDLSPAGPGAIGERKARLAGLPGALALLSTRPAGRPASRAVAAAPAVVAADPSSRAALELVARVAPRRLPVLVLGETGTGKEVIAQEVHRLSGRTGPFRAVNMAAIPETLAEAELFGTARGAFTGADRDRPGVLEASSGGTLFLDEIGDLPLPVQAKLLRVLQEHEVRRLGETRTRKVDLRIVAATHRDLPALVAAGQFRLDLYHRLAVVVVTLPPLRERPLDLAALLDRALGGTLSLTAAARRALLAYPWPGNVRELLAVVEAARAMASPDPLIGLEHLPVRLRPSPGPEPAAPGKGRYQAAIEEARRRVVAEALAACGGNRTRAAQWLGLSRQSLVYELRKLGLK